jgi:hypothetical protein
MAAHIWVSSGGLYGLYHSRLGKRPFLLPLTICLLIKIAPSGHFASQSISLILKGFYGGPSRTRTYDPLIMSQLL